MNCPKWRTLEKYCVPLTSYDKPAVHAHSELSRAALAILYDLAGGFLLHIHHDTVGGRPALARVSVPKVAQPGGSIATPNNMKKTQIKRVI